MPKIIKRMNDNTFFILYALSKHNELKIDCLKYLYQFEETEKIFEELEALQKHRVFKITFFKAPRSCDEKVATVLYKNTEAVDELIDTLNYNIENNISVLKALDFHNPLMNYFNSAVGCKIELIIECEKLQKFIDRYYKHQRPIDRIYSLAVHRQCIGKYFKGDDGKNMLPNPKIKLSRITDLITNHKKHNSRYNFWHSFKRFEADGHIKISNLLIDEYEPTVDFEVPNIRKFIRVSKKEPVLEYRDRQFEIYTDIIINLKNGKYEPCNQKSVRQVLVYALKNPNPNGAEIGDILEDCETLSESSFSTVKNSVNNIMSSILETPRFVLIENKRRTNERYVINSPN